MIDEAGDAPDGTDVTVAEVWVEDPQSPDGLLLQSYFGKRSRIVAADPLGPGVTVVVGPKFKRLSKGKKSLQLTAPATVCVPPAPS